MKKHPLLLITLGIILFIVTMSLVKCTKQTDGKALTTVKETDDATTANANKMLAEGKQTFRFETFGDETYWTDALQINKAIAGEKKRWHRCRTISQCRTCSRIKS